MYVERLLQINVATLAALGTLLLGMGQRSLGLPLLMIVVAAGSIWLTDVTGWFRLNRKVANVAALAAVAFSLRELSYYAGDVPVLGVAPMLVYLQIVLLLQEKDRRIYWQLMTLSLLQVVVAAAFSQGLGFGCVLIVYMLVGFSAMALLLQYGQAVSCRRADEAPRASAGSGRWPLGSQPSHFGRVAGGSGRAGIRGELFARLAAMGLGTLALTLLLFFTVPRFGQSAWRGAGVAPRQVVGFSGEVILGELGQIFESPEEVMRLELVEPKTGRPHRRQAAVYLRGTVLSHYLSDELQAGLWRTTGSGKERPRIIPPPDPASTRPVVLQRITVEPLDRDELFCIWPFVATEKTAGVQYRGQRLLRPADDRGRRFQCELGTTAFVDGVQAPIVPLTPVEGPEDVERLLQLPHLPILAATAERWMAESGLPDKDRIGRARWLERKFHDADRFQYSLEGQQRDETVDPIEDFIANNPRGHCEYFATALALMLRGEGIPARVIVGFMCDEYDDLGNYYQVRQWHAHTWVEAYLEPEHIPQRLLGDRPQPWAGGAWLRLEPTPGGAAGAARADHADTTIGRIERAFSWLESLWDDYVMEMDRSRQKKAIYEPLVRFAKDLLQNLRDPQWWRGVWARIVAAADVRQWPGLYWLWLALVLLVAAPTLWISGRWVGRNVRRLWSRLTGRGGTMAGTSRAEIEFYRRMEVLLARHGLVRRPGQTQQQFAASAGAQIAQSAGQPGLESVPVTVTEAFYQVRFGRRPLDTHQSETVEQALATIAACGFAPNAANPANGPNSVKRNEP